MSLIRRNKQPATIHDPFSDMESFFDNFWRPMQRYESSGNEAVAAPRVDISEDEAQYTIKADLPGIKKEGIDLQLKDNVKPHEYGEEKQLITMAGLFDKQISEEVCCGSKL